MIDEKPDALSIAHHNKRRDISQPLADHLAEVSALADGYATKLSLPRWAALSA